MKMLAAAIGTRILRYIQFLRNQSRFRNHWKQWIVTSLLLPSLFNSAKPATFPETCPQRRAHTVNEPALSVAVRRQHNVGRLRYWEVADVSCLRGCEAVFR